MDAKLRNVNDRIGFGQNKEYRFIDVFKHSPSYIEWIIRSTEICFNNLEDFLSNGQPLELDNSSLSETKKHQITDYITKTNPKASSGDYLITLDNINYLKNKGIITEANFKELQFNFNEELTKKNEEKVKVANLQ
jgi:hypothetical protein